jgi:hypothetical protein
MAKLEDGTFWAIAMALNTINNIHTVPSQSSVGQTGIERHPMAPLIVA